ncbi:uncharacterized protein TNCV_1673621 [Trichonephila clavipes]|nr:uncharacterized protein TNCV_1673621 [Trichonephila clavipes]
MVAQRLTYITPPDATPDQLWQRVEAAWCAVPHEHIHSLFESMPRLVAVWLGHRTPDRKDWVQCPMRPNTFRVPTKNVLVKSVGPKVLWAESRVQGTGEYFPPIQSHGKIVEVEIDGGAIYSPFGEFLRAKMYCHLYGAQGLGQRQAYF